MENQKIGPLQWQYYALHLTHFATRLEVQIATSNSHLLAQRHLHLHVMHGVLPTKTNTPSVPIGVVSIMGPKNGRWYIGIFNPTLSNNIIPFSLLWRLHICEAERTGDECKWPVFHMEVCGIGRPFLIKNDEHISLKFCKEKSEIA